MFDSHHRPTEADVRRLLAGTLSARDAEALRQALRNDSEAQQMYDRLVAAERALEGTQGQAGLGISGTARVGTRLFASLRPSRRWAWSSWSWPIGLAAATAAVAAVMLTPGVDPYEARDGFGARGSAGRQMVSPVSSDRVLQVLQVSTDEDGQLSVRPAGILRPEDDLRFAAFVRSEQWRVSLLAVLSDGQRHVLLERATIAPRPAAQRLDIAFRVPEAWRGPVRFVGVFEASGEVDLHTVDLTARDDKGFSVRVVRAMAGGPD